MITRRAYKRACWEIDTVENNCDSHCHVRVDSRNACESAPSCCRCRKQPAGWGRKRRRSTRERERPGSDGAESWSVTSAGCSTSSGRVRRRWRRWRGSRRWCTKEDKRPGKNDQILFSTLWFPFFSLHPCTYCLDESLSKQFPAFFNAKFWKMIL